MINIKNSKEAKDLQNFLLKYNYDLGKWGADGDFGNTSKKALDAMVRDVKNPPEEDDGDDTLEDRILMIKKGAEDYGFTPHQVAYILATVKRETGDFEPVREAFWLSENWRKKNLRYYPYYGRGYVQITWKTNYEKFSKLLNVDLVNNPDLALNPDYAMFILFYGFKHGTFTGKKISDYINDSKTDYYNARRCINILDHAREIAKDAEMYYKKYFS